MRVRPQALCLHVFVLLSFCAPDVPGFGRAAHAQATAATPKTPAAPAEPAGYRKIVEDAKQEYDRGNYLEARALFAKAFALFPNARALRGQGMAEFELRNYGDSVASLEKALASTVRPLEGSLRTETEQLLGRARSFVARVNVAVEPTAAVVIVDGVPMPLSPQGNLVLEVGSHQLEFRAEGYAPEKRVMKVIGGEEDTIRIVLPREQGTQALPLVPSGAATTSAGAPPVDASAAPKQKRPLYKNPWLWSGVGVATAALATGLAVGLSGGGTQTREPPVDGFDSKRLP